MVRFRVMLSAVAASWALGLSAVEVYVGPGCEFTLQAKDFSPPVIFDSKTRLSLSYKDPVTGKPREAFINASYTSADSATFVFNLNIQMVDESKLKGVLLSRSMSTYNPPVKDLWFDSVHAASGVYQGAVVLSNPFVSKLSMLPDDGGASYEALGKFFGTSAPKILVECVGSAGAPVYVRCKVDARSYRYVPETGDGRVLFSYPKIRSGLIPTGYFIFRNRIGLAASQPTFTYSDYSRIYAGDVAAAGALSLPPTRGPDGVRRMLWALNNYDDKAVWDASHQKVLVISWKHSNKAADPASAPNWVDNLEVGKQYTNMRTPMFTTASPELRNTAKAMKFSFMERGDVDYKVAQLLGMPPYVVNDYNVFLELWVAPSSLVRPSPDPETTDMEAEIDFQYATEGTVSISSTYIGWFDFKLQHSYLNARNDPWPFTGFGYTYYWGSTRGDVYGASEFVIKGPAEYNPDGKNPDANPYPLGDGTYVVNRIVRTYEYLTEQDDEAYKRPGKYY